MSSKKGKTKVDKVADTHLSRLVTVVTDQMWMCNLANNGYATAYREFRGNHLTTIADIAKNWKPGDTKFAKQVSKLWKDETGHKLDDAALNAIGNAFNQYRESVSSETWWDITDNFNWQAGDFGDRGSCFFGGMYSEARRWILDNGGQAMRLWNREPNDQHEGGIGRCWMLPTGNGDEVILFNAYPDDLQLTDFAAVLVAERGDGYHMSRVNMYGNDDVYINSDVGVIVSTKQYERHHAHELDDSDALHCCCCNERLYEEEVHTNDWGEVYCESCYDDHYTYDEYTGNEISQEDAVSAYWYPSWGSGRRHEITTHYENTETCEECGSTWITDDMHRTCNDSYVCEDCVRTCESCNDVINGMDNEGSGYCDDCHDELPVCEDCGSREEVHEHETPIHQHGMRCDVCANKKDDKFYQLQPALVAQ